MKNAQLWKRILHEGLKNPSSSEWIPPQLIPTIIAAPIIVDTRRGTSIDTPKCLAAPFPRTWIDWVTDDGALMGALAWEASRSEQDHHPDPAIEKQMMLHVFCEVPQHGVFVLGHVIFHYSAQGEIEQPDHVYPADGELWKRTAARGQQKHITDMLSYSYRRIATLFELLGCKNVGLKEHSLALKPREERDAGRRGRTDDYRYHTLIVRPAGAKSDHPGEEIGNMPRHVCRGHFAEYGPDFGKGLLFGKYAGRFYVPPHMKGDKRNGVVEKDYEVRV